MPSTNTKELTGNWFYGPYWERLDSFSDANKRLIIEMAYANRSALHYSTRTRICPDGKRCDMCLESARLAFQYLQPKLLERFLGKIHSLFNWGCQLPHPSGD
jgi:hypothetical protein